MHGNIIGPVRKVTTGTTGKLETVQVDVGGWLGIGERVVSLQFPNFTSFSTSFCLILNKTQTRNGIGGEWTVS